MDKKIKKEPSFAKATEGQGKNDESKEEVAHLKNKILELENQVKRIFADYQNLEKRVATQRGEWLIKANKDLILKFLPAIDFLLLSSIHIKDDGLKLSIQKFFDILKEEGVEKIEVLGKKFDPNLMEALRTVAGEENEVMEELRVGFRMGDEVIRPAEVTVGKKEVN
jgi:molecular chaperone GrpE